MRSRFLMVVAPCVFAISTMAFAVDDQRATGVDLGQLTLHQAVTLFGTANRELQAARRAVEASRADTITASQHPNPNLSINTTSIDLDHSTPGSFWDRPYDTVVRIDQLVERGNKRGLRMDASAQALNASQDQLADTFRQQRFAVISAYYDLLLAQQKQGINNEISELYQKTLSAAELRLKAGDISPADVTRIRVDALRAQNDARQAEADRAKAQVSLGYYIGREREASSIRAADSWPALEKAPEPTTIEDIINRRPDVMAAQARVKAAQANRDLARAQRSRDITVGAQYEHYPPDGRNSVGVGISIPLFTRYYYQGEIQRAEVDLQAAEDALEQAKAQARADLARTRADLEAAADRLQRFHESLLAQARKAGDAAQFAYSHGALGVMDLLDAWRTLRATEIDSASAEADYAKSLAAWQAAIYIVTKES